MTKPVTKCAVLGVLLLAACATPGHQPAAPVIMATAVKSGTMHDGEAHVYAYLGTYHGLLFNLAERGPSAFFINGSNVGTVNYRQCMFIELPPGTYSFSWKQNVAGGSSAPATRFTLAPNQNAFLPFDIHQTMGAAFGLIGALADPSTGSVADRTAVGLKEIRNMKIILPEESVVAKIRPLGR